VISSNIDIGQLIIAGFIATVGWFLKLEITRTTDRLDKHERAIQELVGQIQYIIGNLGLERRTGTRD
jgi:hypothetical protein